jgi:ribosome-associated protein
MNNETDSKEKDNRSFIELNAFLKKIGLAATGGQAKNIIRSGQIRLNNQVETRNKKKLFDNDIVEFEEKKYAVKV